MSQSERGQRGKHRPFGPKMRSSRKALANETTRRCQCDYCGTECTIFRQLAQGRREPHRPVGHVKHLYCMRCQKRTPHREYK